MRPRAILLLSLAIFCLLIAAGALYRDRPEAGAARQAFAASPTAPSLAEGARATATRSEPALAPGLEWSVTHAPSGTPANGWLLLNDGRRIRIDAGHGSLLSPTSGASSIHPAAFLADAGASIPLLADSPNDPSPARSPRSVTLADGFIVTGRMDAIGAWRVTLLVGRIDPADRADRDQALAAGEPAPPLDDLIAYLAPIALEVASSGAWLPTFLPLADGYELIGSADRRIATLRIAPPRDLPIGATYDLGTVTSREATGLHVELRGATDPQRWRLDLARAEPLVDAPLEHCLRRFAPAIAEAWFGADLLRFAGDGTLDLLPIGEESAAWLTLITPAGQRSAPQRVSIQRGVTTDVALDAAPLFAGRDAEPTTLRGRLLWQPSDAPIAGATLTVQGRDASITATSARDGTFALGDLPRRERVNIDITGFDPDNADRRHTETIEITADHDVTWRLARYRFIVAEGLAPPLPGLPPRPLAFVLEAREPGGTWRRQSADVFRDTPHGVEVSVLTVEREYRVAACWSPLFQQRSEPVGITAIDERVTTWFALLDQAPRFLDGLVRNADGSAAAYAHLEWSAAANPLPPGSAQCDRSGRFHIGPVCCDALSLSAFLDDARADIIVDPRHADDLELILR